MATCIQLILNRQYFLLLFPHLLLLTVFTSCQSRNKEEYQALKDYASRLNFPLKDNHYYLFFPGNQCKNCFQFNGSTLPDNMNERLYFISGFPDKRIKGFKHFIYDSNNVMLSLKFLDYGSKIISIENENISHITELKDFELQMDSIVRLEQQKKSAH